MVEKSYMKKWLEAAYYKKIAQFLGNKVIWLLSLGFSVGIALFVVEVAFAYGLQSFLKSIGVMEKSVVILPWWVPESELSYVLIFFLLVGTFRCFLQFAQLYLQGLSAEELRFLLRKRILHWAFHSESMSSSQVTLLLKERTDAAAALVQNLSTMVVQLTCGLLLGLSLMYMAPLLTLFTFAALALLLLPIRSLDKKISVAGKSLNEEGEKINRQLLTSVKNLLLMQIYGTQKAEEEKAQVRSVAIRAHHLVYYANGALKFALPQFVGLILICLIAALARTHIDIAPGKLVSFFYLFVRFSQTLSSAAHMMSLVVHYWPQIADLAKWWADHSFDGLRNTRNFDHQLNGVTPLNRPVGWRISNLSYSYPGTQEPVIHGFNAEIFPGQCVVITGPSGVGKSTLLNILLGGSKPQSGAVEVFFGDQQAISMESVRASLLQSVGYVGAESFLIEGTVCDNLLYGLRSRVSEQEIREACRKAECQFIFDLPQGLHHHITEQGQGLSAGQKQRLSLARALLRKPKILILDEATANLDMETEQKLVDILAQLKKEMTIIGVTHRKALLEIADQEIKLGSPK